MWSLHAFSNRAEDLARQWDPEALPGLSKDPQAEMWHDIASGFSRAATQNIAYGCVGGDPPDPPTRSQCYPLYDIIQLHRDLARESLVLADRHRQSADDVGTSALPASIVGDQLADLMERDLAAAASRLRDEALRLEEFAQYHQAYVEDLEPYSC